MRTCLEPERVVCTNAKGLGMWCCRACSGAVLCASWGEWSVVLWRNVCHVVQGV